MPLIRRRNAALSPSIKPRRHGFVCVLELPETGVDKMAISPRSAAMGLLLRPRSRVLPAHPADFMRSFKLRAPQRDQARARKLLTDEVQQQLVAFREGPQTPTVYLAPGAVAFELEQANFLATEEELHGFLQSAVRCRQAFAAALRDTEETTDDEDLEWSAAASVSVSD